jgi:alginate O-acetyltransferase complex protein AlgI
MVFSSLTFLYLFLPAVLLLYFLAPARLRNAVLLGASLLFYFCGEQIYLLLMVGEILVTYAFGRLMEASEGRKKKLFLIVFLLLSFGLLGLFKYADLIPETVNSLAGEERLKLLKLPLPIGISFYVFQSVSYGIDVYRGKYPAERSLPNLALYVSFFPQLIAGPVVRFETVKENLRERTYSMERVSNGLFRFTVGLGKKVLIADRLYAFCDAASKGNPSVIVAWAEALAFLLYVYFDFSGYSDMAIGLAHTFGFDLPENFDHPLVSRSFREFWRRWHISLGTWFRDYLYIPLGGSRKGLPKHIVNLLVVWACTGLWHGASWNFVLWGLSFGIMLMLEVILERAAGKRTHDNAALSVFKRGFVLAVTVLLFVWFRFTDLSEATAQFKKMFGGAPLLSSDSGYLLSGAALLLAVALIGATPLPLSLAKKLSLSGKGRALVPVLRSALILFVLVFATAYLVDGSFSPFLYFRF